jgi:hypothetical protein
MKRQILKDCVYKTRVKDHKEVKKVILNYIEDQPFLAENSYIDNISKFDWPQGGNFERPWVQYFLPYFEKSIGELCANIGVSRIRSLDAIWFQQYVEGSSHGWHIHDGQFTGVYYLELPKNSPRTEFMHPFTGNIDKVKAKEGDVIFFPSHIIHRAPSNKNQRKTIISYNFNILDRIMRSDLENTL